MDFDVIVLGAGIVGVSCALQLTARGKRVVLIDRRDPGEETSYGNAGLLERASVIPYGFPHDFTSLLRYASNRSIAVRYDLRSLPTYVPWLARYWWESSPARLDKAAQDMLPLIVNSLSEHQALISQIGQSAERLVRREGLLEAWRSTARFEKEVKQAEATAHQFGLKLSILDTQALHAMEPAVGPGFVGALHWQDPQTVSSPGDLTKRYAELFQQQGGIFLQGDATTLQAFQDSWSIYSESGELSAKEVVLALGPWSDRIFKPLGYRIPLAVKRGYHLHYRVKDIALQRPIVDTELGYVIAPMKDGLRLTTGIELAGRDLPPSPLQLMHAEQAARKIFSLGNQVEDAPWMGMRPCLPDMRPVIGPASRHKGLWFCFGHNHHGLTLGPISGRLLAEMITGTETFTNPAPYSASRFN